MNLRSILLQSFLVVGWCWGADATPPEATISNGTITAKLLLPDAEKGYYRGTRFDWSGQIESLKYKDHEYFGKWFEKYDPKLHDAIMGPVEEFAESLGYDEAQVGETFIRIGVGALKKPEERRFERFKTYDIVDSGEWTVKKGSDWIEFTQNLGNHNGYSYRYTKRIALTKGKPEMVIHHTLKNTGKKAIATTQYNHNFFVLDGQPTGPDASVTFPFEPRPTRPMPEGMAEIRGSQVAYLKELGKGQSVYNEFEGFGKTASDYDIKVENKKSGAGVRIQGDQPIAKMVYWSIRSTMCPEAYIALNVAPGSESKWNYKYTFYELQKP